MTERLVVFLTGIAGVVHAQQLLPKDAELAGEYVMAAYHARLLSDSQCGKYASLDEIDVDKIQQDVIAAFPDEAHNDIRAALNSKEFQNGARLLQHGGIDGMVEAQVDNGLSQEAACARTAGALEQSFRTLESDWRELTEEMRRAEPENGGSRQEMCLSRVYDDSDDILELNNGAIVEISTGYVGYIGSRKNALPFREGEGWKLLLEGKRVFRVSLLRDPSSCRAPSTYEIEAAANDQTFIITGEKYEAKTYCFGWTKGDRIAFLDGGVYSVCASASLFNVDKGEICEVWCE